jgi:hypothetical protein
MEFFQYRPLSLPRLSDRGRTEHVPLTLILTKKDEQFQTSGSCPERTLCRWSQGMALVVNKQVPNQERKQL